MTSSNDSLNERVAKSIQQLSLVATELNSASDQLAKAVFAIDTVLQSLNIGVPTWVTIRAGGHEVGDAGYWSRELGYAKVGNRWGISLCLASGDETDPEAESRDEWAFNDAPRWLRIEGVAKIPELLEALIKSARETTEKIKVKTAEASHLASAIAQAAGKKSGGTLTKARKRTENPFSVVGAVVDVHNEAAREHLKSISESMQAAGAVAAENFLAMPDFSEIFERAEEDSGEEPPNRGGR
jgi:hypothetical protein